MHRDKRFRVHHITLWVVIPFLLTSCFTPEKSLSAHGAIAESSLLLTHNDRSSKSPQAVTSSKSKNMDSKSKRTGLLMTDTHTTTELNNLLPPQFQPIRPLYTSPRVASAQAKRNELGYRSNNGGSGSNSGTSERDGNPPTLYVLDKSTAEKVANTETSKAAAAFAVQRTIFPHTPAYKPTKAHEDIETHVEMNSHFDTNDSVDVIIQAFRFVKLDAHLNTLVAQFGKLQKSHDNMLKQTTRQETKFNAVLDRINSLANLVTGESARLREVEMRMETEIEKMNGRLDQAVEKIIKSSATSNVMVELSKESNRQMDKIESIASEVLKEVKAVKVELGDVGQVSIQTIYNTHKLEENLMAGLAEMGNRTIYALRQEAQIIERPVLLENESEGSNFPMQADGRLSSPNPGGNPSRAASATSLKEKVPSPLGSSTNKDGNKAGEKAQSLMPCLSRKGLINENPRDCGDIQLLGHSKSGIYKIFPRQEESQFAADKGIEVFCDLSTHGGGWTVIQQRSDNQTFQDFYRNWKDYESGFGSASGQYWIGLTNLASLTRSGDQELSIGLTDWDNSFREANYAYFRVSNTTDKFRLHLADYSGTAGDSLAYHNSMPFSAKDQDNDMDKLTHCAQKYQGGWWYKSCHQSNLNGPYLKHRGPHDSYAMGINWYSWRGYYYTLRKAEMKIRNRQSFKIN